VVSVIVSVRSRQESLRYCIRGALWQTMTDYEVIIVNYGNGSVEVPNGVRLINWPTDEEWNNPRASNIGAANANGEWFVFLNCDIIMAPQLLEKSIAILQRAPDSHVYWGRFDLTPSGTVLVRQLMDGCAGKPAYLGETCAAHAPGDFLALHRDIYLNAGGYDEQFSGYGAYDSDLSVRLSATGHTEYWGAGFNLLHQHHEPQPRQRYAQNKKLYRVSKRAGGLVRQGGAKHFEQYGC